MTEHYIFDFDGTISDSYPIFVRIFHQIADERNLAITMSDSELDRELKNSVKTAFNCLGWQNACTWSDFIDVFHTYQKAHTLDFCAFPDAELLLKTLRENGKKCYIYTHSGEVVHQILKNMGLYDYFDFILDGSYGFPSKPAPDALLFMMKKLGLEPETCIMIGDRPIDAQAGMNAGMQGCLWDADGLFPDFCPDVLVRSLADVAKI